MNDKKDNLVEKWLEIDEKISGLILERHQCSLELIQFSPAQAGDKVYIPSGTIMKPRRAIVVFVQTEIIQPVGDAPAKVEYSYVGHELRADGSLSHKRPYRLTRTSPWFIEKTKEKLHG